MIKRAFFTATGGRPMKELELYFIDKQSELPVYRYQDGLGRFWMAHNRWARHRIPACNNQKQLH